MSNYPGDIPEDQPRVTFGCSYVFPDGSTAYGPTKIEYSDGTREFVPCSRVSTESDSQPIQIDDTESKTIWVEIQRLKQE